MLKTGETSRLLMEDSAYFVEEYPLMPTITRLDEVTAQLSCSVSWFRFADFVIRNGTMEKYQL